MFLLTIVYIWYQGWTLRYKFSFYTSRIFEDGKN